MEKSQSTQRFQKFTFVISQVSVYHTPSVLGAQPHWALVGLRVDAEQVLQARPGERAPGGATHGAAIHGALRVGAAPCAYPQHARSAVGAGHRELLLLLTAGGLCRHVLAARTLVVYEGERSECKCITSLSRRSTWVTSVCMGVFLRTAIAGGYGGVTGLTLQSGRRAGWILIISVIAVEGNKLRPRSWKQPIDQLISLHMNAENCSINRYSTGLGNIYDTHHYHCVRIYISFGI